MWKLKPSAVSLLFFTLRYPALLNTIMVVFGYLSWGTWQTQLVSSSFPYLLPALSQSIALTEWTVTPLADVSGDHTPRTLS